MDIVNEERLRYYPALKLETSIMYKDNRQECSRQCYILASIGDYILYWRGLLFITCTEQSRALRNKSASMQ